MKSPATRELPGIFFLDTKKSGMDKAKAEILDVANEMADAARLASLKYFRRADLEADNKLSDGFDPVTAGDREAEMAMRAILKRRRPRDGILGEEFGVREGESGLRWVLDPIDGTRAYIAGAASWGVLISLEDENGPLLGVIDQPYIGERFIGGLGVAKLQRGDAITPLRVRQKRVLENATLTTTFPEIGSDRERLAFEAVRDRVKLTRYGFDCYGYALLALGQLDLVIEAGLSAYDISAPIAVIEAAGGVVTDWQGNPAHGGGQVLAAASHALHDEALEILNT